MKNVKIVFTSMILYVAGDNNVLTPPVDLQKEAEEEAEELSEE